MSFLHSLLLPGKLQWHVIEVGSDRYLRCEWQRDDVSISFDTAIQGDLEMTRAVATARLILLLYQHQHQHQLPVRRAILLATMKQVGLQDTPRDQLEKLFKRITGVDIDQAQPADVDYFCAYLIHRHSVRDLEETK